MNVLNQYVKETFIIVDECFNFVVSYLKSNELIKYRKQRDMGIVLTFNEIINNFDEKSFFKKIDKFDKNINNLIIKHFPDYIYKKFNTLQKNNIVQFLEKKVLYRLYFEYIRAKSVDVNEKITLQLLNYIYDKSQKQINVSQNLENLSKVKWNYELHEFKKVDELLLENINNTFENISIFEKVFNKNLDNIVNIIKNKEFNKINIKDISLLNLDYLLAYKKAYIENAFFMPIKTYLTSKKDEFCCYCSNSDVADGMLSLKSNIGFFTQMFNDKFFINNNKTSEKIENIEYLFESLNLPQKSKTIKNKISKINNVVKLH